MSARQLNRIRQNLEHQRQEESEEELSPVHQPKRPAFQFMDDDSESEEESESDAENSDEEEEENLTIDISSVQVDEKQTSFSKKKNIKQKTERELALEEERLMEEAIQQAAAASGHVNPTKTRVYELYAVNKHNLNAGKEMKNLCGVKGGRVSLAKQKTQKTKNVRRSRKTVLVDPPEDWPLPPTYVGGGLRMTNASAPLSSHGWDIGCQFFEYEQAKDPRAELETVISMQDPNIIAHYLQRNPFKIEALLALSQVLEHHGQQDHSAELVQRALFALESAWHPQFLPWDGNSRMDITSKHNRIYFETLARHIKQVGRNAGCSRVAFNLTKILWSMDPKGDPMGMLFRIDYYALCARECQFLIDLSKDNIEVTRDRLAVEKPEEKSAEASSSHGGVINQRTISRTRTPVTVMDLPNMQFSVALAWFWMGKEAEAKDQLARALLNFPSMLRDLLSRCEVSTSAEPWKTLLSNRVFANAKVYHGCIVSHMMNLFLERNATLWKVDQVLDFLAQASQHAIDLAGKGESPSLNEEAYANNSPLDKYRSIRVEEMSDRIALLPPELLGGVGGEMNPEAAQAMQEAQAMEQVQQMQQAAPANEGNLDPEENPLLLMLQTLLPWNTVRGTRNRDHSETAIVDAAEVLLRVSVVFVLPSIESSELLELKVLAEAACVSIPAISTRDLSLSSSPILSTNANCYYIYLFLSALNMADIYAKQMHWKAQSLKKVELQAQKLFDQETKKCLYTNTKTEKPTQGTETRDEQPQDITSPDNVQLDLEQLADPRSHDVNEINSIRLHIARQQRAREYADQAKQRNSTQIKKNFEKTTIPEPFQLSSSNKGMRTTSKSMSPPLKTPSNNNAKRDKGLTKKSSENLKRHSSSFSLKNDIAPKECINMDISDDIQSEDMRTWVSERASLISIIEAQRQELKQREQAQAEATSIAKRFANAVASFEERLVGVENTTQHQLATLTSQLSQQQATINELVTLVRKLEPEDPSASSPPSKAPSSPQSLVRDFEHYACTEV